MQDNVLYERAEKVYDILLSEFPLPKTALHHKTPLELLVATILSAQCTDTRVNEVTKGLFQRFHSAEDFVKVDIEELQELVRPTGFYHNKAKAIKLCCKKIAEKYNGAVPDTMEELVELPGVGRKTANVILGNVFGKPGIVVDTHVKRIAVRLGLTQNNDPVKIEFDLMALLPKEKWTVFSHLLINHGRKTCVARKPRCLACSIATLCPFRERL